MDHTSTYTSTVKRRNSGSPGELVDFFKYEGLSVFSWGITPGLTKGPERRWRVVDVET